MPLLEILGLVLAAAAAGLVNAVAGGGTIITFPVLLFYGTPPVVANATSTLALVIGTAGSIFGFRGQLEAVRPWLARFVPVSLLGGLVGSGLLVRTSNEIFAHLVPFLILFATVLFFAQGAIRSRAAAEVAGGLRPARHLAAATFFQFIVAVYGGYFGAGIGILMLASLGFIGFTYIHEMNALKNVLGSLINVVAASWFVGATWFFGAGLIDWPKAGVMTLGALAGYFLGAHFSQRIPREQVRRLITAIGLTISAYTFWHQFA
jgi:uncharacterized membrane protein YfcA